MPCDVTESALSTKGPNGSINKRTLAGSQKRSRGDIKAKYGDSDVDDDTNVEAAPKRQRMNLVLSDSDDDDYSAQQHDDAQLAAAIAASTAAAAAESAAAKGGSQLPLHLSGKGKGEGLSLIHI